MLGWLTPNIDEFLESQSERSIVLPGSLWYLVSGALSMLADPDNWEEFGDASPEATAQYFTDVLEGYLMSDFRNVGQISAFLVTAAIPFGWLIMSGQTIAQSDYPELVPAVPSTWLSGSNIVLPDARNRFLVGAGSGVATGAVGGSNTHTLTVAEMPSHNHTVLGINIRSAGTGANMNEPLGSGTSGNTGSGNPHNNMPSYLGVRLCIYAGR